jgi:hypothetical protein
MSVTGRFVTRSPGGVRPAMKPEPRIQAVSTFSTASGRPRGRPPEAARAPAKSRFIHICPMAHVMARRHATTSVQAARRWQRPGCPGHLVQTATLPGPWVDDQPGRAEGLFVS